MRQLQRYERGGLLGDQQQKAKCTQDSQRVETALLFTRIPDYRQQPPGPNMGKPRPYTIRTKVSVARQEQCKVSLPIIRSLTRNPVHPLLVGGVTNGLLRLPSALCVEVCAEIAAFGSYDALAGLTCEACE